MTLNFYSIMGLLALYQSITFAVFFFVSKKGNRLSNRILGSLLFAISIYITIYFVSGSKSGAYFIKEKMPVIFLCAEFHFLFGPLLYFYTRSILDQAFDFKWKDLYHFVPFFFAFTFSTVKMYLFFVHHFHTYYYVYYYYVYNVATSLSLIIYFAAVIALTRSAAAGKPVPSEAIRLSWIRPLLILYAVVMIVRVTAYVLGAIFKIRSPLAVVYPYMLQFIVLFIFFLYFLFSTLRRPEIFSFTRKYEKSDLKAGDKEAYKEKLLSYMEESRIYLNPLITITMLSKKISVPVPYLSQIINESFGQNFCDFINRYRIEESKKHLLDVSGDKKTVLEIAYLVGFNSKSTFYEAFKKQTGLIPSDFIKKYSAA